MTRMIYDPDYDDAPAPTAYDIAVADAERLYRENAALQAKLDALQDRFDEYRDNVDKPVGAVVAMYDEAQAKLDRVRELAESWRYVDDLKPWQEGGGPGPDEAALDGAAVKLLEIVSEGGLA